MKSFTLTQSQPTYTLYQSQRFLSVTVNAANFGTRQLLIEERDKDGTWSLAHGAPILTSDHAGFTLAMKKLGQRLRFKAVGSGACDITISTNETPNLSTQFIASDSSGTAIEAEEQESRDYAVGELFYFEGTLWRVTTASVDGETPTTNPEKFEEIGGGASTQSVGTLAAKTLPDANTINLANGSIVMGHLGANTVLTLTGASAGDSGLILLGNGSGHDGVGYTVSFFISDVGYHYNFDSHTVVNGDLADFAAAPGAGEYNFGTIGWFYDGVTYYLYVSEVKPYQDILNLPA